MNKLSLTIIGPGASPIAIQTPKDIKSYGLDNILQTGVTFFFIAAIIIALFFVILGGFRIIVSGDDKQRFMQARHSVTFAVLGLVIALLSFTMINLIGALFGVHFFGAIPGIPWCQGQNNC